MHLLLFHPAERRLFAGKPDTPSPFGHQWGGAAEYAGLVPAAGRPPVHLFFRLNSADPAGGVRLHSAEWLPLLCAVRYGATALGYRVRSDEAVDLLRQTETEPWDGFPTANYPDRLPVRAVSLVEVGYDPLSLADVMGCGAVFGYDHITADLREQAGREALAAAEMCGGEAGGPDEALRYYPSPFVQGRPVEDCPDPGCVNHGRPSSLLTLAVFEAGWPACRELWGPNCDDLQIIWQVCPACGAVQATNQCT